MNNKYRTYIHNNNNKKKMKIVQFFRHLQKLYFTCKERGTIHTRHPLLSTVKLFVLWLGNIPTESASHILRQGACMVTLRIDFPVGRKLCLLIDIHVASIRIHQFKEENHFNFSRPILFCLMCAFEYVNYTFNYWFNDIYVLKFSQI